MLTQLPNGNWIDLRSVKRVTAYPERNWGGAIRATPDRVLIVLDSPPDEIIICESFEQAERVRDDLARKVNDARTTTRLPE